MKSVYFALALPVVFAGFGCAGSIDEREESSSYRELAPTNGVYRGALLDERLSDADTDLSLERLAALKKGEVVDVEPNGLVGAPYRRNGAKVWRARRRLALGIDGDSPRLEIVFLSASERLMNVAALGAYDRGEVEALSERYEKALAGLQTLLMTYEPGHRHIATISAIHKFYSDLGALIQTHLRDPNYGRYRELLGSSIGAGFDGGSTGHAQRFLARTVRIFSAIRSQVGTEGAELLEFLAGQLEKSADLYDRIKNPAPLDLVKVVDEKVDELNALRLRFQRAGVLIPTGWTQVGGAHSAPSALRRLPRVKSEQAYTITVFNAGGETKSDCVYKDPDADILAAAQAAGTAAALKQVQKIGMGKPRIYRFYGSNEADFKSDLSEALELRRISAHKPGSYIPGTFRAQFARGIVDEARTPSQALEDRRMQVIGNCTTRNSLEYLLDALIGAGEGTQAEALQTFIKSTHETALPKAPVCNPEAWEELTPDW